MLKIAFVLAVVASAGSAGLALFSEPAAACAPGQIQVTSGEGFPVTSGEGFPVCAIVGSA